MHSVTFVCWKWRSEHYQVKFEARHVNVLVAMLRRHYRAPHHVICVTDDPTGVECDTHPLWPETHDDVPNPHGKTLPRCWRRLKIFSRETTDAMGVQRGAPVVSVDLDVVITDDLRPVVDAHPKADFVGWRSMLRSPTSYNGSLFKFQAGSLDRIWTSFDPRRSPIVSRMAGHFGSDQGWISTCLGGTRPAWGLAHGVISYGANRGNRLVDTRRPPPAGVRIVIFNGRLKPWDAAAQRCSPWITDYWR